ncbi:hypothetical protein ACFQ1S_17385, partial [Kibdelosporangium lantanae]
MFAIIGAVLFALALILELAGASISDTINSQTIITAGLPGIRGTLTINGNHATITRDADAPQFRIITNWGDLTLNDVTVSGGRAPDGVG